MLHVTPQGAPSAGTAASITRSSCCSSTEAEAAGRTEQRRNHRNSKYKVPAAAGLLQISAMDSCAVRYADSRSTYCLVSNSGPAVWAAQATGNSQTSRVDTETAYVQRRVFSIPGVIICPRNQAVLCQCTGLAQPTLAAAVPVAMARPCPQKLATRFTIVPCTRVLCSGIAAEWCSGYSLGVHLLLQQQEYCFTARRRHLFWRACLLLTFSIQSHAGI